MYRQIDIPVTSTYKSEMLSKPVKAPVSIPVMPDFARFLFEGKAKDLVKMRDKHIVDIYSATL